MGLLSWFWLAVGGIFTLIAVVVVVITNVRRFKFCNGVIYDTLGENKMRERISYLTIIFAIGVFVAVNSELEIILPLRLLIIVMFATLFWLFLEFCSWVSRLAKEGWIYENLFPAVRKRGGRSHGRVTELRSSELRYSSSRRGDSTGRRHYR